MENPGGLLAEDATPAVARWGFVTRSILFLQMLPMSDSLVFHGLIMRIGSNLPHRNDLRTEALDRLGGRDRKGSHLSCI